jgi:hypothetical protein
MAYGAICVTNNQGNFLPDQAGEDLTMNVVVGLKDRR